jgi:hypothetical protein
MSYELFAHYFLDTGLRRYDDVDGFFTTTTPPPAGDISGCASRFITVHSEFLHPLVLSLSKHP